MESKSFNVLHADIEKAKKHALANTVKLPLREVVGSRDLCDCGCMQYIPEPQDKLSVCNTKPIDLWHLGQGYPIYLMFIKNVLLTLLLATLFFIGPTLATGIYAYQNVLEPSDDFVTIQGTTRFARVSFYSFYILRVWFGFDYGIWIYASVFIATVSFFMFFFCCASKISGEAASLDRQMSSDPRMLSSATYTMLINGIPRGITE